MYKNMLLFFVVALPSFAQAASLTDYLPGGVYMGTGQWNAPSGKTGTHDVRSHVHSGGITTRYSSVDENGVILEVTDELQFHDLPGEGQFQVVSPGGTVGRAECVKKRCRIEFRVRNDVSQESIESDGLRRQVRKGCYAASGVCWRDVLNRE